MQRAVRALTVGAGLGVAAYLVSAGIAWRRFGNVKNPADEECDPLLDQFMPIYEISERHHILIAASSELTFSAACEMDLNQSGLIASIFRARELILRARPSGEHRHGPLLAQMKALGWSVLAESRDREIVMGAVTQPWMADAVFRAVPPDQFAAFREPGYVKIAWSLRADPIAPGASIARTETRVITCDPDSHDKFRRYWSFLSPGIVIIRKIALRMVKHEAERCAQRPTLQ